MIILFKEQRQAPKYVINFLYMAQLNSSILNDLALQYLIQ